MSFFFESEMEEKEPQIERVRHEGPKLSELGLANNKRKRAADDEGLMPEGAAEAKKENREPPKLPVSEGGNPAKKTHRSTSKRLEDKRKEVLKLPEDDPLRQAMDKFFGEGWGQKPLIELIERVVEELGFVGTFVLKLGRAGAEQLAELAIKKFSSMSEQELGSGIKAMADLLEMMWEVHTDSNK